MGFFDSAQEVLDWGVSTAKGAVSGVAVEQQGFTKGFVRLCGDGWLQGWHERNGGNVTYRLTAEDVASCRSFFYDTPGSWMPLDVPAPNLAGEFFMSTGAGKYFRNVMLDPASNIGIVEIDGAGNAWRVVWGFKGGGMPTSELPSHIAVHSVRKDVTKGASRVLYHAHPTNVIALTFVLPLDARTFSRALWKSMMECLIVFPQGVGVVPWTVPGGPEIAKLTAATMQSFDACVWAHHGLLCSGSDFDSAFGLMHTIEKAATIYAQARIMNGGSGDLPQVIPDEGLRDIASAYGVEANEEFLD